MFKHLGKFAAAAILVLTAAHPVLAADTSQTRKSALTGRAFAYEVAGYHICRTFTGENALRWLYLAAPNGETGKTGEETFDRRDIRSDVLMLSWTEASGASVTDLLDLGEMALHASFVTPDGKRFFSDATVAERASC